jgi:hypothetical protein
MGEFPTSTATDTELIALGEQLEGLLHEYMDAWLEWAPSIPARVARNHRSRRQSASACEGLARPGKRRRISACDVRG